MVVAALTLLPGCPVAIRAAAVTTFALVAPGLAVSRFLPSASLVDRLALATATSASLVILVSLLLVALDQWSGPRTFAELICITTALVAFPEPRARSAGREDTPAPIQETAQPERTPAPIQETAQPEHTPAPIQATAQPDNAGSPTLAELHRKASSADPTERRSGLGELAQELDGQGEHEWAAELRLLAAQLPSSDTAAP